MYNVHMHAGAIRKLLYGCVYVREIIHSLIPDLYKKIASVILFFFALKISCPYESSIKIMGQVNIIYTTEK